jgi:molybdopterin-binding protein
MTMDFLDAHEAADLLRIHVKRVQKLARDGLLPASRVGRKWLFRRAELEALVRPKPEAIPPALGGLSARNHLAGTIVGLALDGLMAEVRLKIGGQELVALITRSSAERLRLKIGDSAFAVIKSTDVLVGTRDETE